MKVVMRLHEANAKVRFTSGVEFKNALLLTSQVIKNLTRHPLESRWLHHRHLINESNIGELFPEFDAKCIYLLSSHVTASK